MADINSTSNAAPTFEERLSFGTSASLGLPDLIGGASGVMGFAAPAPVVDGFLIKPEFDGTAPIKSYTLALDVYVDDAYKSKWFALLQTDPTNVSDAEFLVNANSGMGINGNYTGSFTWDAWHRIVLTVQDLGNGNSTLSKYLDGNLVGSQSMPTSRFQIDPVKGFMVFSDDGASQVGQLETQPGFVSSVMFTDQVLTGAQVAGLGGASADGILSAPLGTGHTVQFDFNASAPLAASFGAGSFEVVSAGGDVLTDTDFGTTAELGIPNLPNGNGTSDEVMGYVGASAAQGYSVKPGITATAADGKIHDYTIIWDLYAPGADGRWMALLQTDPTNTNDADFLLRNSNGIGISSNYTGTFNYDGWNRVAVTVHDNGNGTVTMSKYINGTLVGTQQPAANVETNAAIRYAIDPEKGFLIFSDNGGGEVSQATPETAPGYVNSVFFTDKVMTTAEIAGLGGAKSGGIMQPGEVDPDHAVQFDFTDGSLAASIGDGTMGLWDKSIGAVTGEAQGVDDNGFSAAHDTPVTIDATALLGNDINPQGHDLVIQSVTAGTGGTVALDQDGNVVFTPEPGFAGEASFSYTVSDGHGVTDTANVGVTVQSPVLDEETQKERHVVFLGIDGVQLDKLMALGPNLLASLDILEAYAGGDLGSATQQSTVSGPGWSTLLTGVWANEHHITGNSNSPIDPAVVSLFERIKADNPDATTASVVSWRDINTGHFGDETGLTDGSSIIDWVGFGAGSGMSQIDADVVRQGVDLIMNEAPTFTFLHLDNVDAVGHSVGFGAAYDQAMLAAIAQLKQILTAIAERTAANPDEDWMLVVGTDHGRDPNGFGHGGQTAGERQIFIASNKEISSDGVAPQTSVASTIAEFLGLSQDGIRGPSVLDEDAVDTHAPLLLATTPADDLQNVATDAALTLVLSERVEKGEGFITIHRASDGAVVETIDVNSDLVTISAGVVTINHATPFAASTGYYVTVDAGAFDDLETRGASAAGNAFAGISDATTWSFTTVADTTAPSVVSTTPGGDAADVAPNDPLVLTFDEAVRKGEGSIVIHRADGSVVETIDVASDAVSIDGKTVTVQPGAALAGGDYYVTVTAGAFEDLALKTVVTLFSENFEGMASSLQPYQSSSEVKDADLTDWTAALPEGWNQVNNTPAGGPVEFQGWTLHDKQSWTATEGDQGRSGFTKGQGVVAVADPDAYDDLNSASSPNKFSALLQTPDIDVSGAKDNRVTLTFDNSWANPTSNSNIQEAQIVVTFDNGETIELAHWSDQAGSPYFKATAINETLSFTIVVPEGAAAMSLAFNMLQAGNAFWWAIDNVAVTAEAIDPHGNAFAGIDDETTWNFSVADQAPVATEFDDELTGTSGDDVIAALAGDDLVSGGAGNDDLDGGIGDDTLIGSEGDDILRGGIETDPAVAGDDALFGGAGDDILIGGAGDDTLDGGEGSDTADYADDTAGIVVDLAAGTAEGDAIGSDELSSIETVIAGSGDDVLAGDAGDNRFEGGAGHDTLVLAAATGAIALDLAAGTVSAAGLGTDSFTAIEAFQLGEGDDTVTLIAGAAAVAIDGGEGHDTLVLTGTGTLGELSHVEAIALQGNWTLTDEGYDVAFQDGAQTLTLDEGLLADGQFTGTISGLAEDDRIELSGLAATQATLGEGNLLTITGGANGLVTLQLDPAADFTGMAFSLASNGQGGSYLSYGPANAGDDVMTGGNGNDSFDGGAGNDTLKGAAGNDTLTGGSGDDLIDGGSGDDSVHGGIGNDTIKAGSGTDTIDAGAGDDLVDAGSGDDVILAGAGNDSVDAGSGDDRIEGGAGDDTLAGGSGHDVFVFAAGFGKDVISDFKTTGTSSDVLEFSHDVFADAAAALAAAHQDGSDVVFAIDADTTLTLKNVQLANLHDFHFA